MPLDPRGEQFDNLAYKASQIVERWNQRFTLDNRRFVERYVNAELRLLVYLRHLLASGERVEERAIFQAVPGLFGKANGWGNDWLVLPRDGDPETKNDCSGARPYRKKKPMFVDYVKLAETPQAVIPSLVWIEASNGLRSGLTDSTLYVSETGFRFGPALEDRESVRLTRCLPIHFDKPPIEEVERRSEIVNRISSDESEAYRERRLKPKAVDQVARVRLFLKDNLIRVGLVEPLDVGYEITDVLIGPFDLRARPVHLHSRPGESGA
jgi:hypothetical protein